MKKLIMCAAAAIVALASCSKTQVINTEDPKEIGFKAVTGVMTKAEQTNDNFSQTLGVIAYLHGDDQYFQNTEFSKSNNVWEAQNEKYWPLQDKLDFIVYSPCQTTNPETVAKKITLTVDNSGKTHITNQIDYLYGDEYFDNTDGEGFGKQEGAVSVKLNHALAKVTLKFKGSDAITVNTVSLEKPTVKGEYTVDYSSSSSITPVWTTPKVPMTDNLQLTGLVDVAMHKTETKDVSIMVVPNYVSDILLTYTVSGNELQARVDLDNTSEWESGKHYTYEVTITTYEIKFKPEVNDWVSKNGTTDLGGTPSI